jgi:archaeosine synthase
MEPIGHEGLGRLLKLEEDLHTPHIVFSKEDLTEPPDLNSTGTITIGNSFDLPPTPMGLDSDKEPYLQLSRDIAVLDNASSLKPEKIVEIAFKFREEAGYSRLIYAPAVEPSNMPILAYLGVDIFDDLNVELRSSTGWALDGGEWIKQSQIEDLFSHNRTELSRWILKIRNAIANGKLRELVEITSLHNPRVSQILHHSSSLLIEKGARIHSTIRSNDLSLNHPSILDFQQRLSDYEPPAKSMVLLILPCSARKPYFKSSSHKRFYNAIRDIDNHLALHIVSVTSPLGLVPRELEFCYPAAHYDIAVTGKWSPSEVEMLRAQLSKLEPKKYYTKAIVHAGSSSEIMTNLVKETGLDVVDTRVERPSSFEGLEILQNIAKMSLIDIPLLNTKVRAKGEARGLAKFQYGDKSAFLIESEISGRMPYKLRCGDLASMSPVVGGFGLTLNGGLSYASHNGPVVFAEDFKLVGDLFAVGVKGYEGDWNIGDQVVIKQNDAVTAVGISKMNPEEMVSMKRGLAVEVRHHA